MFVRFFNGEIVSIRVIVGMFLILGLSLQIITNTTTLGGFCSVASNVRNRTQLYS